MEDTTMITDISSRLQAKIQSIDSEEEDAALFVLLDSEQTPTQKSSLHEISTTHEITAPENPFTDEPTP